MANGKCECCGAKNVTLYPFSGVKRCYSCHKTKAEPMGLPKGLPDGVVAAAPAGLMMVMQDQDEYVPPEGQLVGVEEHAQSGVTADDLAAMGMVEPPEPSWDDFKPITPKPKHSGLLFVSVRSGQKIAVSGALIESLKISPVHFVLARIADHAIALRFTANRVPGALKLTPGRGRGGLTFGAKTICTATGAQQGRYAVTITSWGCIVHLDRPVVTGE